VYVRIIGTALYDEIYFERLKYHQARFNDMLRCVGVTGFQSRPFLLMSSDSEPKFELYDLRVVVEAPDGARLLCTPRHYVKLEFRL